MRIPDINTSAWPTKTLLAVPLNKLWSQLLHHTAKLAMISITCLSLYRRCLSLLWIQTIAATHARSLLVLTDSEISRISPFPKLFQPLKSQWITIPQGLAASICPCSHTGILCQPKKVTRFEPQGFLQVKSCPAKAESNVGALNVPCRCTSRETGNQVRIYLNPQYCNLFGVFRVNCYNDSNLFKTFNRRICLSQSVWIMQRGMKARQRVKHKL